MVRIANPNTKESNWHISEIDPDVEYLIEPLLNAERIELGNMAPSVTRIGAKKGTVVSDIAWVTKMILRASLRETKGILDPDNDNKELEFKFSEKRISKRLKIQLCQREIYNKLPSDLLDEVLLLINGKNTISEEEEDDVGFTSDSSREISTEHAETVMETTINAESEDVPTGLE